jgi:hypothetical protein
MTLDASGNLGIGSTASPTSTYLSKLFVYNATGANFALGGGSNIDDDVLSRFTTYNVNNANSGNEASGNFYGVTSIESGLTTTDSNAGADSGGYIVFKTKPEGGALATRMVITAAGTITSPGIQSSTTSSPPNMFISPITGLIQRSVSSLRYKNTVVDATHGLTELLTLRPVTYKGNKDGDTIFGGLIAEEVHAAGLTEFVIYDEEGQPDSLSYSNMVSLCIKAIQEQQDMITSLTARLKALEGAN